MWKTETTENVLRNIGYRKAVAFCWVEKRSSRMRIYIVVVRAEVANPRNFKTQVKLKAFEAMGIGPGLSNGCIRRVVARCVNNRKRENLYCSFHNWVWTASPLSMVRPHSRKDWWAIEQGIFWLLGRLGGPGRMLHLAAALEDIVSVLHVRVGCRSAWRGDVSICYS